MKHRDRTPTEGPSDRDPSLVDELGLARLAAHRAGAFIAERWRSGADVRFKGRIDPVSDADLGAERIILDLISTRFPDDHIVAEESGAHPGRSEHGSSGRRWFVDPLDGTTNFSRGLPHFCVSIAAADDRGVRVGVIHDPIRQVTFEGARGHGAWRDGQPMSVTDTTRIDRALVATGFPYDRHTARDNNTHRFAHILRRALGVRRAGSAALDLAYVAAGWLDGYWEDRLNPWDLAAGALLVTEAGGRISTFSGTPWTPDDACIIAGNSPLTATLAALLSESDTLFAGGDPRTELRGANHTAIGDDDGA